MTCRWAIACALALLAATGALAAATSGPAMLELVRNGTFEQQEAFWTFGPIPAAAGISVVNPYAGKWHLRLTRLYGWLPGELQVGNQHLLSGYAEQTLAISGPMVGDLVLFGDGSQSGGADVVIQVNGMQVAAFHPAAGWQAYTSPPIEFPPGAAVRLALNESALAGEWSVDNVSILAEAENPMARHRHAIVAQMVTTLKGITGSSYWSTLGSRVYTRFRAPSEIGETEFPILFVIETPIKSKFEQTDRGIKSEMHLRIIGYVRETSSDPLISNATAAINKLRDDVVAVLLADVNLLHALKAPVLFDAEEFDYGVDPVFAGFALDVTIPYFIYQGQIGPLAT